MRPYTSIDGLSGYVLWICVWLSCFQHGRRQMLKPTLAVNLGLYKYRIASIIYYMSMSLINNGTALNGGYLGIADR